MSERGVTPYQAAIAHAEACRQALVKGRPRPKYEGPSLSGTDLSEADLSEADFSETDFSGTDLTGASLSGTDLYRTDLTGARLAGTCLDPKAPVPPCTDEELASAGLEVHGERVYGWRTRRSDSGYPNAYTPHRWHTANALSVDASTLCHPGIYFGGHCPREIRVWAYRREIVFVSPSKGVRARRVWALRLWEGPDPMWDPREEGRMEAARALGLYIELTERAELDEGEGGEDPRAEALREQLADYEPCRRVIEAADAGSRLNRLVARCRAAGKACTP